LYHLQMFILMPIADKWERKADLPFVSDSGAACAVNGEIYYMGGSSLGGGMAPTSNVVKYDPNLDKWTKKTDMPTPRAGHCLAAVNGKIYAIGGHSQQGTVSVIDVYDPQNDKWIEQIEIPKPRSWFASAVVNDKIYLMGGSTFCDGFALPCQTVLSLVEEYTPDSQKISVNPQDKITSTWGSIKSVR